MDSRTNTAPAVDWKFLPAAMPGVAALMRDRRKEWGDAHVNECWKRGVLQREPGWFFAREGALMVGTPFGKEAWTQAGDFFDYIKDLGPALLLMREPVNQEAGNAAH